MCGLLLQFDTLVDGLESVFPGTLPGPAEVVFAAVVVIVGWYLSKVVVRITGRTVARRIERPSVTRTVLRGVRVSVILFSLVVAAVSLGVETSNILLSAAVLSAVVGVVLAPLIGSFINGIFILTDRPFEIGDMIEIADAGHTGFVEDITIRYTKVFTLENTFLVIPNSEIHTRDVINYSAEDERTRISVQFEVTYESNLSVARRNAVRAARSIDEVLSGGPDIRIGSARYGAAPVCDIIEYADHGVLLRLRFWIENPYKQALVRSDVQAELRRRFADNGIEFAYPHTHHVFDETSGTARVAVDDSVTSPTRRPAIDPETEPEDR